MLHFVFFLLIDNVRGRMESVIGDRRVERIIKRCRSKEGNMKDRMNVLRWGKAKLIGKGSDLLNDLKRASASHI